MKRLNLLVFAFAIIFLLPGTVCAQFVANSALINLTDNDGNGYANVGDSITISVQGNNIEGFPTVDLSNIGLGTHVLAIQAGTTYRTLSIALDFFPGNPANPNYLLRSFIVSGKYDDDADPATDALDTIQTTINPTFFDLVQVQGVSQSASLSGNTLTITITDERYQAGTTATVDLTPVGGNATTPMTDLTTGVFQLNYTLPPNTDYNGPFAITLNDPVNVHPSVTYVTTNLEIDNIWPTVDQGNTSIIIQSGNATALPGDVLRITGAVTAYDFDSVQVYSPDLTSPPASVDLAATHTLSLISSSGPGNPAMWQADVVLDEADFRNTSHRFTFTFTDNAGNASRTSRYIAIDLDKPRIMDASAKVLLPNDTDSSLNVATTTCSIEIISTITVDIGPDPLTVTVDLSAIGGPNNQTLTRFDPSSDVYEATFVINKGTLEDGTQHIFVVSARDTGGNLVAQATTPAIRIDSNPPVISNVQLTASTAYINVGSTFTIECTATGLENGSASVDLSAIGLGGADVNQLYNVGGNTYRRSFILPDSRNDVGYGVPGIVDGYRSFTVYVNDTVSGTVLGHLEDANTNAMMIDNEPPTVIEHHSQYTHNLFPADDDGYARIGDTVSFHVRVASAPTSVTINMLNLGYGNMENMVASASSTDGQPGWYDYILPMPVATGTFNQAQEVKFWVSAVDDGENATSAAILLDLDNKPVEPTGFAVEVTYKPDRNDSDPGIINLNKSLNFKIPIFFPITDPGIATIDLSSVGGSANQVMNYDNGSYSYNLDTSATTYDSSGHRFRAVITDLSGNRNVAQSNMYRVDCEPPSILDATVELIDGGSVAIIGDELKFRAEVENNEGMLPTVDLSDIGGNSNQELTAVDGNWFEYTAIIQSGNLDEVTNASWTITAWDNDYNYATASTNEISIDNYGPDLVDNLDLQINSSSVDPFSTIKIGDVLEFTLDITNTVGTGSAIIDLRAVGGTASETMFYNSATSAYSLSYTAAAADREYTNYKFVANVYDANANKVITQSPTVPIVDCQPVSFSNSAIIINQDNGDNPIAGIANLGDVLMVYASASAYLDADVSATIGSGTTDFESAVMTYNSATNRHEAVFTVKDPGVDGWITLTGSTDKIYYKLSATDDVGNLTEVAPATSTFTLRNVAPELDLANTQLELSPNRTRDFAAGVPVYNQGTDTVGDRLVASITFAAGLPMHRAWLDFSELGSGTLELTVTGNMAETSAAGVAISKFAPINYSQKTIFLYGQDQAGNISVASRTFWVDNTIPQLTGATFDGEKLNVGISETFTNLNYEHFEIVGSNPPPLNTPASLDFISASPTQIIEDLTSFEISLHHDHMKEMAQWASTPIYLKVTNVATSSLTDLSGNELPSVNYYPITITDSLWREPAQITQFTMTHNWPNSITLDFFFNKDIASSSLIASNGVLLVNDLTYDFTSVDYTTGYVFQPDDLTGASWPFPHHLRIVMSDAGRDWLARKVGNGANQLRFASRSAGHVFAYDSLGKPMNHIPTSAGVVAADNRPTPAFDFKGPPNSPLLDLDSRTLVLTANDRLLLSISDFEVADSDIPLMVMPSPTNNNRVTSYINKAVLHDIDGGGNTVLELEGINIATNTLFASTTVNLKLTSNDFANIINLFKANDTPAWRMAIGAGAFTNLWGTPSNPYLPSGNPGAMQVINPTIATGPQLAACALSDKPPVNQKSTGDLEIMVEFFPTKIDGTIIPLQPQIAPTVNIINQNDNSIISAGTFTGYSERTVDGELRAIYSFTNSSTFANNLQRVPARIEIAGVTDIFGNVYPTFVETYAFDLNSRNDSATQGFSDTASAPIEIDTQKPIVNSIVPGDVIGRIPAGSTFKVNFDETMSAGFVPNLQLATTSATMNFTFVGWTATATADYTNNSDFTADLPNGIWYYQVTGGQDSAGNAHDGTADYAFPVQVRTYAPEVSPGNITFRSIQSNISSELLTDQPWAYSLDDGIFSIKYDAVPTQFPPHYLEIFDEVTNIRYGQAQIHINNGETMATATFSYGDLSIDPGATGPKTYSVRIKDSGSNETETISTIVYDNQPPDVTAFSLSGIGSETSDISYYRPTGGNLTLNVTTNTTTDALKLAVYSYSENATTTCPLNSLFTPGTYSLATGTLMTNGTYTLTIVDFAGNIGSGPSSKDLVVDDLPPEVVAIYPDTAVGNAPADGQTFRVIFSEMMDASATEQPVLTLTDFTSTITMNWDGWEDPDIATTAVYTNANAIVPTMASGNYTYRVTGGQDLANNALTEPSDGDFEVEVQSEGPHAHIDVITLQPHIYNSTPLNLGFNPDYGNGSATLRIDYSAGPFNTTHDLRVYNSSGNHIATYAGLPVGDLIEIEFSDIPASWTGSPWPLSNGEFFFKIADKDGNVPSSNLVNSIIVDLASPTIDSFDIESVGTDTAGLTYYYSTADLATFTITTTDPDRIRLMLIEQATNATHTVAMSGTGTDHQVQYGTELNEGAYDVTVVDIAGNYDDTNIYSLIVDNTVPQVNTASPTIMGGLKAGMASFDIEFDSQMNTGFEPPPTARLATEGVVIDLSFSHWTDDFTARFTNTNDLSTYPTDKYYFQVTGARDLAGNENIDPASGPFVIDLFTTPPAFDTILRTQQTLLFDNNELLNRPFSINALPGVATLSIAYNEGPFQVPHSLLVYDSTNIQVASIAINPDVANQVATTAVDAAFFGTPGNIGPATYVFKLVDDIGNLSATSSRSIIYDALEPNIGTATISNVSDASSAPLYYNDQLHGLLRVDFETDATDQLLLVLTNGTATSTYAMNSNTTTGDNDYSLSSAEAAALNEGIYVVTAADLAGNLADGNASLTLMIVDRSAPAVLAVIPDGGLPLSSSAAGMATFTVVFDEAMNQLGSATPSLAIATSSKTIACTFESWLSPTQARFISADAITTDLPQGDYFCAVTAWDITGNQLITSNAATLDIRSRGPVISSIYTESFQSTTASDSSEILLDTPFSFAVAPGAATLTVQLAKAPDSTPLNLHFMQGGVTVASYTLVDDVDYNTSTHLATFTWSATNGPNPANAETYEIKLVDASGDFSLESYNWTMDASAPVALSNPLVSGGELATNSVYFSPLKHGFINVQFSAIEDEAPRLRVLGANSTDTYAMSAAGTNAWAGAFEGRFSRGTTPKQLMPDGHYSLDLVDRAGNVGILASGDPILYDIIIDSQSPGITTYSTLLAGNPVTSFSPAGGNLEIRVVSPETLDEKGIWWMDVLNDSNVRINRLPITNVGGNYTAYWDGTDTSGALVIDGNYSFRAADYAGNRASGTIGVYALTTEFKVTGSSQISSTSAKIWFNHDVDPASLAGAAITTTGLTISSIGQDEAQAITFNVSPNFAHEIDYTFTITPGTVSSIFGAGITAPNNTTTLTADGEGPSLSEVNFANLSGQHEFKVVFNETYKTVAAANTGNYTLTGPDGTVTISQATTQSDKKTVLLTAAENLVENADYQITATAIEDQYGNLSPASNTLSFKGRDLTPPVLEVSAFSNPANENDIIVVVVSNEELKSSPTLNVAQSNAPVVTTRMQQGSNPLTYMIGITLSSSYSGNGTLAAYGKDLAGNEGSGSASFAVAYLSASKVAAIESADSMLTAEFAKDSLKSDSFFKIIAHKLEKSDSIDGQIKAAMQQHANQVIGLRAGSSGNEVDHKELQPLSNAYEISVASAKINKGFNVFVEIPEASETAGLGLFYQSGDNWKFVSARKTRGNKFAAKAASSQVFAILRDTKAPDISLDASMNLTEPFTTARPEFTGQINESGSGLDLNSVTAHIDAGPAQKVSVDASGKFTFKPLADLTGGRHDLVIKAADNTGNQAIMPAARFEVKVPLVITQIIQYPNPARQRAFIRISANRSDVLEQLVKVKIYDVAGHKITTLDGIRAVNETWGINARYLYDIPWDLRTSSGKMVANGVYFARIEIRDPDNPAKKVKETFKIAVLR